MLIAILSILIVSYLFERYLDWINRKSWNDKLPEELREYYDEDEYTKAQKYDRAKLKVSTLQSTFSLILMIVLLLSGSFSLVDSMTKQQSIDLIIQTILFFGILALLSDFLQLPFSIYNTFVIEEQFGFNRSTIKTFFADKLKGYLLAAFLGGSLLALFVLFYEVAGKNFWWIAWISISAISILIAAFLYLMDSADV